MSQSSPERQYWDASPICALLSKEVGRYETCERLVKAATQRQILIVTSTITLAEVTGNRSEALRPEVQNAISEFFQQPFVIFANVDRRIGRRAHDLRIEHYLRGENLPGNDSIHLATALLTPRVSRMFSYDDDHLTRADNRYLGANGAPMQITHLIWSSQSDFFDVADQAT